jgi:hypothetical protein
MNCWRTTINDVDNQTIKVTIQGEVEKMAGTTTEVTAVVEAMVLKIGTLL